MAKITFPPEHIEALAAQVTITNGLTPPPERVPRYFFKFQGIQIKQADLGYASKQAAITSLSFNYNFHSFLSARYAEIIGERVPWRYVGPLTRQVIKRLLETGDLTLELQ